MKSTIQIIANGGAKVMADAESREAFATQLRAIVPGAQLDFIDESHSVASLVKAALARGATVIAAGGGDGTVNSVASTPNYQWQRNDGAGFVNIVNATGSSYTFLPSSYDDGAIFRCVIGVIGTNATTTTATLSVVPFSNTAVSSSIISGSGESMARSCSRPPSANDRVAMVITMPETKP